MRAFLIQSLLFPERCTQLSREILKTVAWSLQAAQRLVRLYRSWIMKFTRKQPFFRLMLTFQLRLKSSSERSV